MTNKSKLNCKKYIGYFDNDERISVEVLAKNPADAIEKLRCAEHKSEALKGFILDTSTIYPCGTLADLCKYDQNTILRCGYLIGREKIKEENITEENKCHI